MNTILSLLVTLLVVVRDVGGSPLSGVDLLIFESGPPLVEVSACTTDADGICYLSLAPGSYRLQFSGTLDGMPFVPPTRQNAAASGDGTAGQGFGFYLESDPQPLTFVVEARDGEWLPAWDLSRDVDASPEPYTPAPDEAVNLWPTLYIADEADTATPAAEMVGEAIEEGSGTRLLLAVLALGLLAFGLGIGLLAVLPREKN